jgi:mannose-6-phosphate isomerase-like protein (cupin superfamily)
MKGTSVFIPASKVDAALKTNPEQGKRLLEPLKSIWQEHGTPINVLEDHKVSNEAEVHRHEGDLWICLQGEVEFVVGGEMINPWAKVLPDGGVDDREIKSKEINDGTSHTLYKGDILWIPAGEPHLHRTEGTARLYIIKVPTLSEFPLKDVPGWRPL